ncbi:MAG: iron-containing redox enzyme family protein [Actinomycetota bacterium]
MNIETIIKERHLLNHPFYEKWQRGKISMDTLQDYSRQYFHYERALPAFLSSALEHLPEGPAKVAVGKVLEDETSHPEPHTDLWLKFASALGAGDALTANPWPRTTNLVETYHSLCAHGSEEALGALYAYESQIPAVAQAKADGLRKFYAVPEGEGLKFFDLHATMDVGHAAAIRTGFSDSELARESAHLALDAWWDMLDQFD